MMQLFIEHSSETDKITRSTIHDLLTPQLLVVIDGDASCLGQFTHYLNVVSYNISRLATNSILLLNYHANIVQTWKKLQNGQN